MKSRASSRLKKHTPNVGQNKGHASGSGTTEQRKNTADPNAILPVKLTHGGRPITDYPATVPSGPYDLLTVRDGRSDVEVKAGNAINPVVLNALTAMSATSPTMIAKSDQATVGITAFVQVMAAKVATVAAGDMSGIEATMTAQVVSMDALFSALALKAQSNFGAGYFDAGERYMRLAFKAQAQCRATAETLGELKNPRPVFAKQVNLANGNQQINQTDGPQQVNNGVPPAVEPARGEKENPSNKLLEVKDGEPLDWANVGSRLKVKNGERVD